MTTRSPSAAPARATLHPFLLTFLLFALLFATWSRAADEHGHDHDHGPAAPTAAALPRFAAVSELFELVGVLDGRQLTLYLDRAPDNAPVTDAQIELEIAGARFKAARQAGDEFAVLLAAAPRPGVLPVIATVTAGHDTDLLAAELDIHEPPHAEAAHGRSWRGYAGWGAATLAALAALMIIGRRVRAARQKGAAA